mgnify:CR=1 FL=1
MRPALRIAPVAALFALVTAGNPPAAHAGNCELALKPLYKCSASYSDGGSSEYCLRTDVRAPGDGQFLLVEDGGLAFSCTCEAKGRAPSIKFGASSRDFFCGGSEYQTLAGKVSATRISGQGFDITTSNSTLFRSIFTCQTVATCP